MNTVKHKYEAIFLLDTRELSEDVNAEIKKLKSAVESIGGEVSSVEDKGILNFARRPKRDFTSGAYVQINFAGGANSAPSLQNELRLEKTVNRVLVRRAAV